MAAADDRGQVSQLPSASVTTACSSRNGSDGAVNGKKKGAVREGCAFRCPAALSSPIAAKVAAACPQFGNDNGLKDNNVVNLVTPVSDCSRRPGWPALECGNGLVGQIKPV
jgi:hypothetical protein